MRNRRCWFEYGVVLLDDSSFSVLDRQAADDFRAQRACQVAPPSLMPYLRKRRLYLRQILMTQTRDHDGL